MANATPVTKKPTAKSTGPDVSELEGQARGKRVPTKTVDPSTTTLADGETVRKDN